jgi:lysozyme
MKTSQNGIKMIENFEGLKLDSYRDGGGVLTIGYGHTEGVKEGEKVTQDEAEAFLKSDIETAEKAVNSLVKVPLNTNEFDSLVSFQFNTGGLEGSTLLKLLNEGNFNGAANEFPKWDHDNGKVVQGLLNRREAEMKLF